VPQTPLGLTAAAWPPAQPSLLLHSLQQQQTTISLAAQGPTWCLLSLAAQVAAQAHAQQLQQLPPRQTMMRTQTA
jgi:hypothetical protein